MSVHCHRVTALSLGRGLARDRPLWTGIAWPQCFVALVASRLDYCTALYMELPLKLLRKLELVQNAADVLSSGAALFQHVTSLLGEQHWLPVS